MLAEGNHAADLADDGGLFGLAHLEELRHPGQAAGDVLGLGGLPGDLDDHVAGKDLVALIHHEDGAHRHEVPGEGDRTGDVGRWPRCRPSPRCGAGDPGPCPSMISREALPVTGSTRSCTETLSMISPNLMRAAHFGEHGVGEGVPFRQDLARLHLLPLFYLDMGPVGQGITFPLDALFASYHQFRLTAQVHQFAGSGRRPSSDCRTAPGPCPGPRGMLCSTRREAVPPMWKVRMVSWVPGSPMDWAARMPMASPMDTGGAVAQIPAVALGAYAPPRLAGEHRPDLHLLQSGFLDAPGGVFVDLFIGLHQHFIGVADRRCRPGPPVPAPGRPPARSLRRPPPGG